MLHTGLEVVLLVKTLGSILANSSWEKNKLKKNKYIYICIVGFSHPLFLSKRDEGKERGGEKIRHGALGNVCMTVAESRSHSFLLAGGE